MTNSSSFLDRLVINPEYERPVGDRGFTRAETFILGWLVSCRSGRTYTEMMRECRLSLRQCQEGIQGLLALGALRLR